jgi:hypothetical protein
MTTEQSTIINDICNFLLVIFGVSVTLFTVLYSFIFTKNEELKIINEQLKLGKDLISMTQRKTFCIMYISIWKVINYHLIILTCLTFLSYLTIYVINKIGKLDIFKMTIVYAVLIVAYISYLLYKIIRGYLGQIPKI